MTKTQAYYYDGMKSSLLWDEETTAWNYSSNAPDSVKGSLYRTIPTLYRGIRIISDSMGKVPFTIYRGSVEYDKADDWANKVELLPNPRRTMSLICESLDRHGCAYLLKVKNRGRYTKELKWMAASTIEPVIDSTNGLTGFKRTYGSNTIEFPVEDVIYFWLPDADVEVGLPMAYPLKAALQAAGVLGNLSAYMEKYFERGAIRPLIVTAKNMPNKDERERMESWLNRLLGGIRNAFKWKIFNADVLDFKQIGDGLDQLQNQTLTADQRQDISLSLGIPQTILFANSANFATSMSDQRNFYDMTVVPRCQFIASVFNEQLLEPLGLRLQFEPDQMDIYQTDEAERSGSLKTLVDAGLPLLMSMDLLGYELTDEQRAELEAEVKAKEERAEEMAEQLAQAPAVEPAEEQPDNGDEMAEEKRWKRACLQAFRKSKPLPLDWISESIPPARCEEIKARLTDAHDAETISASFQNSAAEFYSETPAPQISMDAVLLLAEELKRANNLLTELTVDHPASD